MPTRRLISNVGLKTSVVCHTAPPAFARTGGTTPDAGTIFVHVTCVVQVVVPLQASTPFQRSFFRPGGNVVPPVFFPPKSRKVCVSSATSVAPVRNPISPISVGQLVVSVQEKVLLTGLVLPNG